MTAQQAEILEKISDMLGEHFVSYALAVSIETEDGTVASCHYHHGNYFEVLGLADTNLRALREQLQDEG